MSYYYLPSNKFFEIKNYDLAANKWTRSSSLNSWTDAIVFENADIGLEKFYFRSTENLNTSSGTVSFSFNMQIIDPDGELVRSVFTASSTISSFSLTEVICKRYVPKNSRLQLQINNGPLTSGIFDFTFLTFSSSVDSNIRPLI